jgi:hypothetical protein
MSRKQYSERDAAWGQYAAGDEGKNARDAFNAGWRARKQVDYRQFAVGPRHLSPIEKIAAEIAIAVPEKRGMWSASARVHWVFIEALREKFSKLGYDWREGRREYLRLKADSNAPVWGNK